ncbi:MAG: hypothetical protein A2V70_13700 [Planctomycetes bacterium RBG_13_63_9]|nr:MAG: hypothetical protein A2V70_13700 [Planctomycetes bacterium RBG_13_63_9]
MVDQHRDLQTLADRLQRLGRRNALNVHVVELEQRRQDLSRRFLGLPADRPDLQVRLGLHHHTDRPPADPPWHKAQSRRPQHAGQRRPARKPRQLLDDSILLARSIRLEHPTQTRVKLKRRRQSAAHPVHGSRPGHPLGRKTDRPGQLLAHFVELLAAEAKRHSRLPVLRRSVLGQIVEPLRQPRRIATPKPSARQHQLVPRLHHAGHHVERTVLRAADLDAHPAVRLAGADATLDPRLAEHAQPFLKSQSGTPLVADQL